MLTKESLKEVGKELPDVVYWALCKLRDYEKSGFEPDELERVKENIHVGSDLDGYIVFGVWNDYCIAENPIAPDPYVTWNICENGFTVWAGHYFRNKSDAEENFFERAYGAMSDIHEYWKR